jgi:hypothetical protein
MPFLPGNYLSLHGRLVGLFRGILKSGDSYIGGESLNGILETVNAGLTATAGGTQAASQVPTAAINQFTTVATAADGMTLPVAVKGMTITVINDGANAMQVFGSPTTSDTIDGVATATGVAVTAAKRTRFTALNDASVAEGTQAAVIGKWVSLESVKSV